MKNAIPFLLFLMLNNFCGECFGQKFYISASAGYNYVLTPQNLYGYKGGLMDSTAKGSYGSGNNYNISFGYNFNDYISAEISGSYLSGKVYQQSSSWVSPYYYFMGYLVQDGDNENYQWTAFMFRLIPSLKFSLKPKLFTPYIKAGLIIELAGSINDTTKGESYGPGPGHGDYGSSIQHFGNNSLGFSGAIGIEIRYPEYFSFFAEGTIMIQNWEPNKEFSIGPYPANLSEIWTTTYPFSSWGFNIGMKIRFGKIKPETK